MYRESFSKPLAYVMGASGTTILMQWLPGWLAGLLALGLFTTGLCWLHRRQR